MALFKSSKYEMIAVGIIIASILLVLVVVTIRLIILLKFEQSRARATNHMIIWGLHPTLIAEIPLITFHVTPQNVITECSICLNEFEDGDLLRQLPNCEHVFHQECIDEWLVRRASCPVCRVRVGPVETPEVIIELPESSTSAAISSVTSAEEYSGEIIELPEMSMSVVTSAAMMSVESSV